MEPAIDRGESVALMEPIRLSEAARQRAGLDDLAMSLGSAAAGFRRSLPPGVVTTLAALVRSMNCYYSNLIEGHDTHPVDIERALAADYSTDARKRDLQLEARAHVEVQQWIDEGGVRGRAVTAGALCEMHRRFGERLPPELLRATNPDTGEVLAVVPGALRERDVKVGVHTPVSPGAVPRFLARFEQVYGALGRAETIVHAAAAHHRLLWVHPFLDGNGRVARLMSHAVLLDALDTGGVWSVARGLARAQAAYKAHLIDCDNSRRTDLDGRGSLSEDALVRFTQFFLQTCLDQVHFMESVMQPDRLRARVRLWADEEVQVGALPPRSADVLDALLLRGTLPRAEMPALVGTGERHARRVVSALSARGVIVSDSTRAPLRLAFPATVAARWLPGLFPDPPSPV